jgi:Lon protease-like protein
MTLPNELPLFPLSVVLFPGMPLPLHIFETRYRRMLAFCLEKHAPFGVVLIHKGSEIGAPAESYTIGTSALITDVKPTPEGTYNIDTVGCDRFRVQEITQQAPYIVARVQPYPFVHDVPAASRVPGALRALLDRYIEQLARAVEQEEPPASAPADPPALACLAAIVLQLPLPEKQHLLEIASLDRLLTAETALLRRELRLVEFMLRASACPVISGRFLAN